MLGVFISDNKPVSEIHFATLQDVGMTSCPFATGYIVSQPIRCFGNNLLWKLDQC